MKLVLLLSFCVSLGLAWTQQGDTNLEDIIKKLILQMRMQTLLLEERIRSDGQSGVKQCRLRYGGTRPYYSESHSGLSVAAFHQHANNIRKIGIGEFIAVLNGVEFRTRHNDLLLVKPRNTPNYHETENIPFPEVPPAVLREPDVQAQILEMRQWFKAWQEQDYRVRDYRPFFKPVLCYLEGAWATDTYNIQDSYVSHRHFMDATNWEDMREKIRFTSYSGTKSTLENYSFLPTTIIDVVNGTIPILAQWDYRMLCHPLSKDLPLNRFKVVDELMPRMANKKTYGQQAGSRAARFQLNPSNTGTWVDGRFRYSLLDELMSEIPGKDNYPGEIYDDVLGAKAFQYHLDENGMPVRLNTAYYHRWMRTDVLDAMGVDRRPRGFADENLFMAQTTQSQVAGMSTTDCDLSSGERICRKLTQKWSYAIPIEIIYLTPLSKWNPYNLEYKTGERMSEVAADDRRGAFMSQGAFNGTRDKLFYQTPAAFYSGLPSESDTADTALPMTGVLDRSGKVQRVCAAGLHVLLPHIAGLGVVRQRYPIMPVHGEGSPLWKEVEALKDIVLQRKTYDNMYREPAKDQCKPCGETAKPITLRTGRSIPGLIGYRHTHLIKLNSPKVMALRRGARITMNTEFADDHTHSIKFRYMTKGFFIVECDGIELRCPDGHVGELIVEK